MNGVDDVPSPTATYSLWLTMNRCSLGIFASSNLQAGRFDTSAMPRASDFWETRETWRDSKTNLEGTFSLARYLRMSANESRSFPRNCDQLLSQCWFV